MFCPKEEKKVWQVKECQKGRGLFSTQKIKADVLVLTDTVSAVRYDGTESMFDWSLTSLMCQVAERNPSLLEKELTYTTHHLQGKETLAKKIVAQSSDQQRIAKYLAALSTNAIHEFETKELLLWDHAYLINHSCAPNLEQNRHIFSAFKSIQKGEELTFAYGLPEFWIPPHVRAEWVRDQKLFGDAPCICSWCVSEQGKASHLSWAASPNGEDRWWYEHGLLYLQALSQHPLNFPKFFTDPDFEFCNAPPWFRFHALWTAHCVDRSLHSYTEKQLLKESKNPSISGACSPARLRCFLRSLKS